MTGSPIFSQKLHEYNIRFQCQTYPVVPVLLLLAAFSLPSGDLYEQSGVFMVPWVASSELSVPVKSHGAG